MATEAYFCMAMVKYETIEGVQQMVKRSKNWSTDQILGSESKYGISRNFGPGRFF